MAEHLHISEEVLQSYEQGDQSIPEEVLTDALRCLGFSPEALHNGEFDAFFENYCVDWDSYLRREEGVSNDDVFRFIHHFGRIDDPLIRRNLQYSLSKLAAVMNGHDGEEGV